MKKEEEEKKEEEKKDDEEVEIVERSVVLDEFSESEISENASEEAKEKHKWNVNARKVTKTIATSSNLRAVNFCYVDKLIDVRGKNRPIAFYVPPKSSNLSTGGVFIYDRTQNKDNSIYLFIGPEAPQNLIPLGEKLLDLIVKQSNNPHVYHIERTLESEDFNKMIHDIGGNKSMMQGTNNAGDQFFFELQFFTTMLHIFIFENDEPVHEIHEKNPKLSHLPSQGAAVIDTSDNNIYLYVSSVEESSLEGHPVKKSLEDALSWMKEQPEFKKKDLILFDKNRVPPNLQIIFQS